MTDRVGDSLGNYHLLRLLGRGAFADVYLAEHQYLEIPAALKVLHIQMEPETHEQFRREARTIAHLQHLHIVRVLDFGIQDQTPYLVIEYAPNGTLRSQHPKGTRLSLEQIVGYVKQIAPTLDYAHQQGVIHRDVKPENLLLNAHHEVVLSDFGIAVVQQTIASLLSQNQAGTPLYMAPEQIQRQPCAASDQYALGVMVYEWLCGEPPFHGTLFEIFSQHLHHTPPGLCARLPQLPLAVEDAVFGALAKDPQQRFSSVQDFATALEEACFATQLLSLPASIEQESQDQVVPHVTLSAPMPDPSPGGQNHSGDATQPQLMSARRIERRHELAQSVSLRPATRSHIVSKQTQLPPAQTNRQRLVRRVRSFWIAGVLEKSLHGAALLALGLQEQPDAVANPWHLVLQHSDSTLSPLPAGTRITQVYDAADGELLILGAPGSGKTTLLLELARDLLDRAERDEGHPIPMVFNLSSWATKAQHLVDWLIDELNSKYQVPRKLAQALVETDQILPLLDGLDEVDARERTACIEALNTYRQEHGLLPFVVCCRSADYLAHTTRVQLNTALAVQPLTERQIDDYLLSGGEPMRGLRIALSWDASLRELASTPLMLSILTIAYHDMPVKDLVSESSLEAQRHHLFETYVQRMLQQKGAKSNYRPQDTIRWLSWLAGRLVQRNQTVFYIERMQPDWLPPGRRRTLYPRIVTGLIYGSLFALIALLLSGTLISGELIIKLLITTGIGLASGLLFGLLNAFLVTEKTPGTVTTGSAGLWRNIRRGALAVLLNGLLSVLCFEGFTWMVTRQLPDIILMTAVIGSFGGLIFGLLYGLLGGGTTEIQPTEHVSWSWKNMIWNLLKFLYIGVSGGLLASLLYSLLYVLSHSLFSYWESPLSTLLLVLNQAVEIGSGIVLYSGAFGGLIGGLAGGLSGNTLDEHNLIKPNQGIRNSARTSLLVGLASVLIVGLVVGLVAEMLSRGSGGLLVPVTYGLVMGVFGGLISGLRNGGIACIQHVLLRWLLWRAKSMPWNYARFLDDTARRILLRKVGGGYIFVHRLLLEYFASLDSTVLSAEAMVPTILAPSVGRGRKQASSHSHARIAPGRSRFLPTFYRSGASQARRHSFSRRRVIVGLTSLTGLIAAGSGLFWWLVLPHPLYTHAGLASPSYPYSYSLVWSPDGTRITSIDTNGTVQAWNAGDGGYVSTAQRRPPEYPEINFGSWSPDGRRIAYITTEGAVHVWDAQNGGRISTYQEPFHESSRFVMAVAWSSDGSRLAIFDTQGMVQIRDTTSGKQLSTYQISSLKYQVTDQKPDRYSYQLGIAWSPDGKHIAASGSDGMVSVWDAVNGSHLSRYQGAHYPGNSIVWSPDGKRIALGLLDGTIQVRDATDGRIIRLYHGHAIGVIALKWSPDGKRIASVGGSNDDNTMQVWNSTNGNLIHLYWLYPDGAMTVIWSPDGKRIASGGYDGTVRVWASS